MRVLHVTECEGGGVVRAVNVAARTTPEHEHIFLGPEEAFAAVPQADVKLPAPRTFLRAVAAVRDSARRFDVDVVHAHSSWAGAWARLAGLGRPIVYQPHCYRFADVTTTATHRRAFWLAERLLAGRGAATVALTPWERDASSALGARTVFMVPNEPTLVRPVTGDDPRARRVVMVGRICPQKDPLLFAAVARAVIHDDPSVSFRWIGDGDAQMRAVLRAAGVDVTGWLGDDCLAHELADASLYLHTAAYEGFPLSVLDAAITRTPVLIRAINAVEGSGLATFSSEEEAVLAVLRILNDAELREDVTRRTVNVPARLSSGSGSSTLRDVYAAVVRG